MAQGPSHPRRISIGAQSDLRHFPPNFVSHNGHLIPAIRLILHADYVALGARCTLPFAFSLLFLGTSVVTSIDAAPEQRNAGLATPPYPRGLVLGALTAASICDLRLSIAVQALPGTVATTFIPYLAKRRTSLHGRNRTFKCSISIVFH
jgi:hypothetical protein